MQAEWLPDIEAICMIRSAWLSSACNKTRLIDLISVVRTTAQCGVTGHHVFFVSSFLTMYSNFRWFMRIHNS